MRSCILIGLQTKYRPAKGLSRIIRFRTQYVWWSDFDLRQDHDMCLDTWRLYVPFSGSSSLTSLTWTQEESHRHVGPRESLGPRPEPTSAQTLPTRVHHSTGVARFSETLYQYKDPSSEAHTPGCPWEEGSRGTGGWDQMLR